MNWLMGLIAFFFFSLGFWVALFLVKMGMITH